MRGLNNVTGTVRANVPGVHVRRTTTHARTHVSSNSRAVMNIGGCHLRGRTPVSVLRVSGATIHLRRVRGLGHLGRKHGRTRMRGTLRTVAGYIRAGRNGLLRLTMRTTHIHTALNRVSCTYRGVMKQCGTMVEAVSKICSSRDGGSDSFGHTYRLTRGFTGGRKHRPHVVVTGVKRSNRSHNTGMMTANCTSYNFSISVKPLFRAPTRTTHRTIRGSIRMINISSLTTKRGALVPRVVSRLGGLNHRSVVIVTNNMVPTRSCSFLCGTNMTTVFNPNSPMTGTTYRVLRVLRSRRWIGGSFGGVEAKMKTG